MVQRWRIANCGYTAHQLNIVDLKTETVVASLPAARLGPGIAWSPNGSQIYAAGGITNGSWDIYRYRRTSEGKWEPVDGYKLHCADAAKRRISGLALSTDGQTLFALNQYDGNCYALNTASGAQLGLVLVGDHPVACRLPANSDVLYVANQGGSEVVAVNVVSPAAMSVTSRIHTGSHPNDMVFGPDGRLFVSCANADCVTVIDTKSGVATENIRTTTTTSSPAGSTPNAVAVSKDGKYLCLAIFSNNNVYGDPQRRSRSDCRIRLLRLVPLQPMQRRITGESLLE